MTAKPSAASASSTPAATFTTGYVNCCPAMTMLRARPASWCTEPAAARTAAAAAVRPQAPSASCNPSTSRWSWRRCAVSLLACKALQLSASVGVELRHLAGEVAERHLPVLLDERVDARLSSQVGVVLLAIRRPVEIGLALAAPVQKALAVEPRHDGHVRRVRARLLRAAVEGVHDRAHGRLVVLLPDLLHD